MVPNRSHNTLCRYFRRNQKGLFISPGQRPGGDLPNTDTDGACRNISVNFQEVFYASRTGESQIPDVRRESRLFSIQDQIIKGDILERIILC